MPKTIKHKIKEIAKHCSALSILAQGRKREANVSEFDASLTYLASSRPGRATQAHPVSERSTKKKKEEEKGKRKSERETK